MTKVFVRITDFAERSGRLLDSATEALFLAALFLFCFKLFWSLVELLTLRALDIILAWDLLWRMVVGLPLIAVPVGLAAFLLFGDEERPGWIAIADLRNQPLVKSGFGLYRRSVTLVASFAFLKLIWLAGDEGADAIDWWSLGRELLQRF